MDSYVSGVLVAGVDDFLELLEHLGLVLVLPLLVGLVDAVLHLLERVLEHDLEVATQLVDMLAQVQNCQVLLFLYRLLLLHDGLLLGLLLL